MCCIRNQWTKHFFIKIYLSFYSRKWRHYGSKGKRLTKKEEEKERAHSLSLVLEIDGETYTQRGGFFLSHTFFREPRGANACNPLQAVSSETSQSSLIGCLSLARLPILCLCPNLTAWLSRGLLPVTHLLDLTALTRCHPLFTNHNVTACQSTRGCNEPKMHVICYIIHVSYISMKLVLCRSHPYSST